MNNNIFIPSEFGKVLNNFETNNGIKRTYNAQVQNANNGQDTVEIGGKVKTNKFDDKNFRKKFLAITAIITGVLLGLINAKKGKTNVGELPFCHEKVFQDLPSLDELDDIAAKKTSKNNFRLRFWWRRYNCR